MQTCGKGRTWKEWWTEHMNNVLSAAKAEYELHELDALMAEWDKITDIIAAKESLKEGLNAFIAYGRVRVDEIQRERMALVKEQNGPHKS
jgi:hypothetical protein